MGNLKRTWEDMLNPGAASQLSARKKARYQLDKNATGSEPLPGKRKRGDEDGEALDVDMPDIPQGPKILSRGEFLAHLGRSGSTRFSNSRVSPRGILRKDVVLKSIFQTQEPYTDYTIRRVGDRLAVLGVRYGNTRLGRQHRSHGDAVTPPSPKRRRVSTTSVEFDVQSPWMRSLTNWMAPLLWWF
jgi:hypothetical protein